MKLWIIDFWILGSISVHNLICWRHINTTLLSFAANMKWYFPHNAKIIIVSVEVIIWYETYDRATVSHVILSSSSLYHIVPWTELLYYSEIFVLYCRYYLLVSSPSLKIRSKYSIWYKIYGSVLLDTVHFTLFLETS